MNKVMKRVIGCMSAVKRAVRAGPTTYAQKAFPLLLLLLFADAGLSNGSVGFNIS
jgi:hypothetical protein